MSNMISVCNLRKTYGDRNVLNGINFEIAKGETFALLGMNGAGKTTALECIEGLRKYDHGTITINGKIGVQLQSSSLPPHIRPMEAVKLFCRWNKTDIDNRMLDTLGIQEFARKQYTQLSAGQKRRLHLALALLNDPDIIFLDEPTAGLDVCGKKALHEQIWKLKSQGKTIVLASHDMAEVEMLCDRIAILNHGDVIFCGTAAELTDHIGQKCMISIKTQSGTTKIETDDIADDLMPLLVKFKQERIKVLDIKVDRGTLEQHFMEMTGRDAK